MQLKTKIIIAFVSMGLITLLVSVVGYLGGMHVNRVLTYVAEDRIQDQIALLTLNKEWMTIRADTLHVLLVHDWPDRTAHLERLLDSRRASWNAMDAAWADFNSRPRYSASGREVLDALSLHYQEWRAIYEKLDDLHQQLAAANAENAAELYSRYNRLVEGMIPISDQMGDAFDRITANNKANTLHLSTRVVERSGRMLDSILVFGLLAVFGALLLGFTFARNILRNERRLRESEEELSVTLQSIGDGVLATDTTGRIIRMNRVAESMTGWTEADAQGKPIIEVLRIVNATTREPAFNPVQRVLQTGRVLGLANHTVLISRDGTEYQIADSAAPIHGDADVIRGVVLVFRDVTEEYAAIENIRRSEAFTRLVMDNLPIGIAINRVDPTVDFSYMNDEFLRCYRVSREQLSEPGRFWDEVYEDPEFREKIKSRILEDTQSGDPERMHWEDVPITRTGEPTTFISARNTMIPEKRVFVSTVWDVTARKGAEDKIKHSHDLMRYIIEHANSGVAVHDNDLRYVYVSELYKRQFHKEGEALIGKHHYEVFPDLPEKWKAVHQRVLRGETVRADRDPFYREDGSVQWTRWECRPWYLAADEIGGILIYTEVITDQVLAEQNIARQKALLEAIYRNAPLVMMLVDADRRVRQVNSFAEQFAGQPEKEMLGKAGGEALRCLHALDDPRGCGFGSFCKECLVRQTVVDTLTKKTTHRQVEASLPLQVDGKTRDLVFLLSTAPLEHEGERMALVTFLDITERKESEENFTALFENINVGVAVYEAVDEGADFIFQDLNEAGQRFSKLHLEDVLGRRVTEVFPSLEEMGLLATFRKVYATGEPAFVPMTLYKDNRITEWVENRVVRLPSDRIVALYDDRTELHQLEENLRQMQKMDAIGQLAGGIAHDFNNQLAGILGYGEMIQKKTEDPDLKRYATQVVTAARRSADLTRKLLMFARKGQTHTVIIDMHAMITEVSDILAHTVNKKIDIKMNLLAKECTLQGDASQIQNAFLNLGVNAADAMKERGELIFSTEVVDLDQEYCAALPYSIRPGRFLRISVTDNGTGISKEIQDKIFEPFFTTKDVGKGTGMGLAAVYGTVKYHGGAINLYSEPGRGTTFRVYLPLTEVEPHHIEADAPAATPAPYAARILVLDDEPLLLDLAGELLRSLGYDVALYSDPDEVLSYYQEHASEIDLVLLDIVMPKRDGVEVFEEMRRINPSARVVVASGYSANAASDDLLKAGALAFVQKPFDQADLSAVVAKALSTGSNGSTESRKTEKE